MKLHTRIFTNGLWRPEQIESLKDTWPGHRHLIRGPRSRLAPPGPTERRVVRVTSHLRVDDLPPSSERWILPHEQAAPLAFDSELEELIVSQIRVVRIFTYNRHARSLSMWEDVLRMRRVGVGLFEAADLEFVADLVNQLGAYLYLDIQEILTQEGGSDALHHLLERFLFDSSWTSQVFPFSRMLYLGVNEKAGGSLTGFGFEPGSFELCEHSDDPEGQSAAQVLLRRVKQEAEVERADWLRAREVCSSCTRQQICGRCLAAGDGDPCMESARALVETIGQVSADLRKQLLRSPYRRSVTGSSAVADEHIS